MITKDDETHNAVAPRKMGENAPLIITKSAIRRSKYSASPTKETKAMKDKKLISSCDGTTEEGTFKENHYF